MLTSLIWSRGGNLSPHADIGYEFWSGSVSFGELSAKDQIVYAFGVEWKSDPRLTANIDVLGRRLVHGMQYAYQTLNVGPAATVDFLGGVGKPFNVVSVAPGIKWNVAGNLLLTGNVLLSVANLGLRANVTPVVGFEWAH
jgi:hypothetical protein